MESPSTNYDQEAGQHWMNPPRTAADPGQCERNFLITRVHENRPTVATHKS